MSRWFAKRRRANRPPLRRRLEVLESRSLLSGRAICEPPAPDAHFALSDAAAPLEAPPQRVTMTSQPGPPSMTFFVNSGEGVWLAVRTTNVVLLMGGAAPPTHDNFVAGRGRHEGGPNGPPRGDSMLSPAGMSPENSALPRIQIAPYQGASEPNAPPPRPPGAAFMTAVNALSQAMAATEGFSTGAEAMALMTLSIIDSQRAAATPHRSPTAAANSPAAAAPSAANGDLNESPDGGLAAIGGTGGAVDAMLDAEAADALTEAELDWLVPDAPMETSRPPDEHHLMEASVPPRDETATDIAVASFDQGMVVLANPVLPTDQAIRSAVLPAEDPQIEMAATAAVFQAFDLGFDAPGPATPGAPIDDVRAAAFVPLTGDAAAPEDATSIVSQRALASALVGLSGYEFLRRRRRNPWENVDRPVTTTPE